MALVGDIILGAREIFTDLPQTLPKPIVSGAAGGTGGTLTPSTKFYFTVTGLSQWGETDPATEQSVTLGGGQNAIAMTISYYLGTTSVRVYYGTTSGEENQYVEYPVNSAVTFINVTVNAVPAGATAGVAQPPNRNTAYLPDTNGNALGVAAIYRWLNDGLNLASTICDGLPDFAAVGTDSGQPVYEFPGTWNKVGLCWYDGYPVAVDRKDNVFRRNKVTGLTGNLSLIQSTDRIILECWPQPSRTSGRTTLTADLSATAKTASLATSNFVLAFGLAKIGNESVYFAQNSSGSMTGLTRGMAGSVPAAWPAGTAVTELNLMVTGTRAPAGYSVGQAASTFYLPPGWEDAMETYLISRFRKAEQQTQESQALLNEFTAKVQKLSATKIIAGPRQIPMNRGSGTEIAVGLGSPFGGVILP